MGMFDDIPVETGSPQGEASVKRGMFDDLPQEDVNEPIPWSDVAAGAADSFLPSFGRAIESTYEALTHPIETGKTAGRTFIGALQKTGLIASDEEDFRPYADAVGQHFKENYGSMEGFKNALATDPVGVLGDISIVLSGGGSAVARAPGMLGRIGEVARAAGHYTNPLTPVVGAVKAAGYLGSEALGLQSGLGGETVRIGPQAGYEGGNAAKDFREHLRGKAPMSDPVDDAREAVSNAHRDLSNDFGDAISKIDDTKPLKFDDIDDAFARAANVRTLKGIDLSESTADFRHKLGDTLTKWRNLDPSQYHTAASLHGLKQQIWEDYLSRAEPGSPEAKIAGDVYGAVKQTIMKQNPEYGKIMQAYEDGKDQLNEVERTLSLKNTATTDTALHKLQAILRNNVNTNYGYRRNLAEYIMRAGSPTLIQKLAGQAMNSPTPRGLGKFALQVGAELGTLTAGSIYAHPAFAALAPMIAMSSPRVLGEAGYYAGRLASPLKYVPPGTATAARAVSPYTQAADAVEPDDREAPATPAAAPQAGSPPPSAAVRGALPVAGSEVGQAIASTPSGPLKYGAAMTTGVGGLRDDIAKHYPNYLNFGSMSPQEQKAALASLHGDTNISINERKRLEKMMLDRRGAPAMPPGVPQGSRAQRSDSTRLVRWVAPDGTIYSPSGTLAH
jgi:hypothetical protein